MHTSLKHVAQLRHALLAAVKSKAVLSALTLALPCILRVLHSECS